MLASYSRRKKFLETPVEITSQGKNSSFPLSRAAYSSGSIPHFANASCQIWIWSDSCQASNVAPFFQAVKITSARRRSPRANHDSSMVSEEAVQFNLTPCFFSICLRIDCFASISSCEFTAAHWKGVCGLGTKVPTLTCNAARLPISWCPILITWRQRSAIALTSSSVSPGCPIMKYSLIVCQPRW